jgi:iron complex transport system substrate-binding protein
LVSRWFLGALFLLGCGPTGSRPGGIAALDDAHVTVTLATPARRVVSLVPAATELLFALGAGSDVVGRTKWCDYPAQALAVPSVGDGMAPNVEAVAARHPDLVVIYRSAGNAAATSKLAQLGIPVVTVALDRQTDFERDARLLATLVGRGAAGDSLIAKVRGDLERATVRPARRPSVFILAWTDPPYTIGGGSYLSEIIDRAGGVNIFGDSDRPSFVVSIEAVVAKNPDFVLVAGASEPAFAARPEWQGVPAVKERRFIRVDGSMFNRPSPRIGEAVATLARALATGGR